MRKGNRTSESLGQKGLPQDKGIETLAEGIDCQALPSHPHWIESLVEGSECFRREGETLHLGPVGPIVLEEGHKAGRKGEKGDVLTFGTKAGADLPQFMHGEKFEEGRDLRVARQRTDPQGKRPGRGIPLGTIGLGTQGDADRNSPRKTRRKDGEPSLETPEIGRAGGHLGFLSGTFARRGRATERPFEDLFDGLELLFIGISMLVVGYQAIEPETAGRGDGIGPVENRLPPVLDMPGGKRSREVSLLVGFPQSGGNVHDALGNTGGKSLLFENFPFKFGIVVDENDGLESVQKGFVKVVGLGIGGPDITCGTELNPVEGNGDHIAGDEVMKLIMLKDGVNGLENEVPRRPGGPVEFIEDHCDPFSFMG
jgi:hypothetical protein